VSHKEILTAQHCVDGKEPGERVWFAVASDLSGDDVNTRPGRLKASDPSTDLALVGADDPPSHPVAGLFAGKVERGQKVAAMGHPTGLWWSYSEGEVAAVRKIRLQTDLFDPIGENWWIQTTSPIAGGSSGGGLWDLGTGQLMGICSRGREATLNFFVHRDYLSAFLTRNGVSH
jgi:S1-C subfamily serine protease